MERIAEMKIAKKTETMKEIEMKDCILKDI